MPSESRRKAGIVALAAAVLGPAGVASAQPPFDCGYRSPAHWLAEFRAAVARGEVADPTRAIAAIPAAPPARKAAGAVTLPCLSAAHVFPFEDTDQLLLTNFSDGELLGIMADAANAMIAAHGDVYDFIGYFLNFDADHTIGAAFYMPIFNDVAGIGDPSTVGTPIFDNRASLGVGGSQKIQGYVMMWNVSSWVPGDGPGAAFTRLALAQEFEHRFAMFLPDLLDGTMLQGDNSGCGRGFHWNWKVDGQGSGMEISEWVGSSPAVLQGSFVTFNTDIPGGVFSYSDLYLMGYVSPAEMDAGNSELRYMDNSNCGGDYFGPVSGFSSADIIAAAGPRVPDSTASPTDFSTGWVMFHLPGDPPSAAELATAVGIMEQHQVDWNFSTLGRGTMDNQLFADCNCNDVPDADDIAGPTSDDANDNGIPDECECLGDLDGDNEVGIGDFLFLLGNWGTPAADLDGDGDTGITDFLILLGSWGPCS